MATTKEMLDEAELAKSYVANSDMAEDQKRTYLRLINITTEATNGISPEQKIQKMTESILLLAASQVKLVINLDQKIQDAIGTANKRQCVDCKAMKHAVAAEEEERNRKIIDQWKLANGYTDEPNDSKDEDKKSEDMSWTDTLKALLMKPYLYILLAILSFSPYCVQILDKIFQYCSK